MSEPWLLRLRGFGVAFGEQVVLASIDLDVPPRGIVSLVASAGEGKSTLLRTLAGFNDAQPELRTWGRAEYEGTPLDARRPALVHQRARLLTASVRENLVSALPDRSSLTQPEQVLRLGAAFDRLGLDRFAAMLEDPVIGLPTVDQRALAIARAYLSEAALVLLDEPTAQLGDPEVFQLSSLIAELAGTRAVILVTHDRRVPQRIGGRVVFLAGGRVAENRTAGSFFDRPATAAARAFVATGRCAVPSPTASPEDLRPSQPPPPPLPPEARAAVSRTVGPHGFHWLIPGALGGLPRPGIVRDLDHDLEGLRRLRVTRVVTLEETETIPAEALAERGLLGWHFPIDDMRAPDVVDAARLCERVNLWLHRGDVVAMHCRAGHGRTGTILAAHLVWTGHSALEALETVRGVNPRWIQTDEQVQFLTVFEAAVSEMRRAPDVRARASNDPRDS